MIKLAIFDLDGTLINSLGDLADATNKALTDFGFPRHEEDKYRYFVGNGAKKLIERALPDGTPDDVRQRVFDRYSDYYREGCMNRTKPYDGMPALVKQLREGGIKCAVASNKPDEFSKRIVRELLGADSFDLVRGKRDDTPTKPAPDIVYGICAELGCEVGEAVMIGDSNVDVATAHNAGISCIGCTWGFRGERELREAGADFIAYTPNDIARTVGIE